MWDAAGATDRDVQTSVLVSSPGAKGEAPRVIYGTANGAIHMRNLYTGEAIGAEAGVVVSAHKNKDVFTGYGGSVSPVETSGSGGLGQVYVVFNDRFGPTEPNPSKITDEIAIAQIDQTSGKVQKRLLVPGTAKYVISSSPVLSEPNADGDRSLVFAAVDQKDWEKNYGLETPTSTPLLFRVPITKAHSKDASIAVADTETLEVPRLTPVASPSLMVVDNRTGPENSAPRRLVTASTADPATPLQTYDADLLAGDGGGIPVLAETPLPPTWGPADNQATASNLVYLLTAVVPVAPNGDPPGTGSSGAGRAPAVLVASYNVRSKLTRVHRLVPSSDGTSLVEAARSEEFPGKPAPQLSTTQNGQAPGDAAGTVLFTTARNLYALDGGDLSVQWKLDPLDALAPGDSGFSRTTAIASRDTVFVSRDNGKPLALGLADGKPLGADGFDAFGGESVTAFGAPALTPSGVLVMASDRGVFAYRSRCANAMRPANFGTPVQGTFAGDDIKGTSGNDSLEGRPGDDCIDGGDGNDTIDGGQGTDLINAGAGLDRVLGGDDRDIVHGAADNDVLDGQDGDDAMDGGDGNDVLKGGSHNDSLDGGPGKDRLYGDSNNDSLVGGSGDDRTRGWKRRRPPARRQGPRHPLGRQRQRRADPGQRRRHVQRRPRPRCDQRGQRQRRPHPLRLGRGHDPRRRQGPLDALRVPADVARPGGLAAALAVAVSGSLGAACAPKAPVMTYFFLRLGGAAWFPAAIRRRSMVAVVDVGADAVVQRDLAQHAPARRGLLDDGGALVVADLHVQGGCRGEGRLGAALGAGLVGFDAVDGLLRERDGRGRQEVDRLQQVAGDERDADVELELALHAADGDRGVVADHLGADLEHDLGEDGVDLAGHDRRALLQLGQEQLADARARAGAHQRDVLGDLRQARPRRPSARLTARRARPGSPAPRTGRPAGRS